MLTVFHLCLYIYLTFNKSLKNNSVSISFTQVYQNICTHSYTQTRTHTHARPPKHAQAQKQTQKPEFQYRLPKLGMFFSGNIDLVFLMYFWQC